MKRAFIFCTSFFMTSFFVFGQYNQLFFEYIFIPLGEVRETANTWKGKEKQTDIPLPELLKRGIFLARMTSETEKADPSYSEKALNYLKLYCTMNTGDLYALSWLGMAYALRARDTWNPIEQLSLVNKAIVYLDKAVDERTGDPDGWYCRYVRGNIYCGLPDFFNKGDIAEQDQNAVIRAISSRQEYQSLLVGTYYYLGALKEKKKLMKEAVSCYANAVAIAERNGLPDRESVQAAEGIERLMRDGTSK